MTKYIVWIMHLKELKFQNFITEIRLFKIREFEIPPKCKNLKLFVFSNLCFDIGSLSFDFCIDVNEVIL